MWGYPAPRPARPRQGVLGSVSRWGQGEAGGPAAQAGGRAAPGLDGLPQHRACFSDQQRSAVLSSSSDRAQRRGPRTWPLAPGCHPGASAQGSRRLTVPLPPYKGRYGTRERHAVEPGEPVCLQSPAPLDLPQRPPGSQACSGDQQTLPATGMGCSRVLAQPPGTRECLTPPLHGRKGWWAPGELGTHSQSSPAGAAGPRHQPGAGRPARSSSLEPPPRSQACQSGTAEGCRVRGRHRVTGGPSRRPEAPRPHEAVRRGAQASTDHSGSRRAD